MDDNETEQICRGGNGLCAKADRAKNIHQRCMPEAECLRTNLLPLEKQIRRDATQCHEMFEATGRREHEAEEARGKYLPRQGYAAGRTIEKW